MAERNQNRTCGPLEEDMTAAIMMIMTNLPGGGCTDPFSVFTFLAFALAVMDLVMEMNRHSMHIILTQPPFSPQKKRKSGSIRCTGREKDGTQIL